MPSEPRAPAAGRAGQPPSATNEPASGTERTSCPEHSSGTGRPPGIGQHSGAEVSSVPEESSGTGQPRAGEHSRTPQSFRAGHEPSLPRPSSPAGPARVGDLRPSLGGVLCYWLLPVRRRVILDNLRQVFGDGLDPRARRRVAQCFYSHVLRSVAEYLTTIWTSRRRQAERVDIVGVEHLFAAEKAGKGILILTGHFGNWELASVAAMLQYERYHGRFHVIRKSLSAGLEPLVFGRFSRAGLKVIPARDALGAVLRALGGNDVVIFILDQHTKVRSPKGIAVEFFGRPAGTNRSLALVAGHSGAPVIPATSYRKPDGRHVLRFETPLEWIAHDDPAEEQRRNTRRYNEVLERFVLEHPDQWFWMHRRWKSR